MEKLMKEPNVLWICADQQRYDTITALGNPIIRTPALDEMAAKGAAFTRAYTQCPVCTPSRASF
jgi:arylsulfatase A-like enzyme